MKYSALLVLSLLAWHQTAVSTELFAQTPERQGPVSSSIADKEMAKRAVFSRHCQICHLGRPNKENPFIAEISADPEKRETAAGSAFE